MNSDSGEHIVAFARSHGAISTDEVMRLLAPLAGLLVCTLLAGIVRTDPRYIPPDFTSDFLLGRADSFHGVYPWAFYAHIAAGPVTLLLGLALMSGTLRR